MSKVGGRSVREGVSETNYVYLKIMLKGMDN